MLDNKNRCRLYSLIAAVTIMLAAGNARSAIVSLPAAGYPQAPRRSFAVGHSMQILDVPGTFGEDRPISVHLWYPARRLDDCYNAGNSVRRHGGDQDCSETPSVYTSRLYGVPLLPQWDPMSWTIGSATSFENLPIAGEHNAFPVIVFSHGSQNNVIDYVYTLEALASFGFIVAAPDHLNNTQDDVRIDFINSQAHFPLIPCFDGLPSPCAHIDVPDVSRSMNDRMHDISAVINSLSAWFGDRVDLSRVGMMGHSRGTITALAAAGGSTTWGFRGDPRVKAIMGLAAGTQAITFGANVQDVTVPTLLVAGTLDSTESVSLAAFDQLGTPSTQKAIVLIANADHRHFDSGLCAQVQSAGGIAATNRRAIFDLQTIGPLVIAPLSRRAMDFCGFETFTNPTDPTDHSLADLVASLTGFTVTPDNVPTTGVDSTEVKDEVVELAVVFFERVLQ